MPDKNQDPQKPTKKSLGHEAPKTNMVQNTQKGNIQTNTSF